ncbi:hypothetical protein OG229_02775 [Streptomyces platensis]|uniref:hypothetical protein n=1 Tax=Streptomyces platensis TaxID=58346 RepID=UPI002E152FA2|nr:hypothetical protein OG229_02775 [Streptomyces platensis]
MKIVTIDDGLTLDTANPDQLTQAYRRGQAAIERGEDTDNVLKRHLLRGEFAAAAGYLHGLAADARKRLPVHPDDCPCRICVHAREALMRSIYRTWREGVAA